MDFFALRHNSKFAFVLCSLLLAGTAKGGEEPKFHFTGNPTVDFFGLGYSSPQSFASEIAPAAWEESAPAEGKKSAFLAAVMSLVVPGSGEVYSGSYLKGAIFFVADVISISAAVNYNNKGNNQNNIDEAYANAHWSAVRYANWTIDNIGVLNPSLANLQNQYRSEVFYSGDTVNSPPPFGNVNWAELNSMESDIGASQDEGYPPNGYTHQIFNYGLAQYYKELGKYDQFGPGWDDYIKGPITASNFPVSYESPHFVTYRNMRAEDDRLNVIATTWTSIALFNHVLSAADAFWSAKRHNNSLHASVEVNMLQTPYGMFPSPTAHFSYDL